MKSTAILVISLIGNLILGIALILNIRQAPMIRQPAKGTSSSHVLTQQLVKAVQVVKTNVLKETFSWAQIESPDYPTYIANLRAVGCPEPTIRDIIVADVNHLYARKKIAEKPVISSDEWWKREPDTIAAEAEAKRIEALERERRQLLTALLGPNWDEVERLEKTQPSTSLFALSGPILSKISPETAQALADSYTRMKQKYAEHLASARAMGQSENPVIVASIRKRFRSEIESLLTPEQLEEFLLRYSHISTQIRQQFQGMNLTPQEFRAIFRARDAMEKQMDPNDFGNTQEAIQKRAMLEAKADEEIMRVLGQERFQLYKSYKDPVYGEAKTIAQTIGLPTEMIQPLYEINRIVKSEEQRIRNDTSMTPEQKEAELQNARQAQISAIRQLLGDEAFKKWEELYGTQR